MAHAGHGAKVVRLGDNQLQTDIRILEQILMREDIKDLPVAVVSVAGAYRGGKSFLLNYFLRYLNASPSARQDNSWLGTEDEPLMGFTWSAGMERNTTGILVWSEPIITTLSSGLKVAVLLMDTQGTFDSSSTVKDCSIIFALSALMSSIQIYNVSGKILETDIQHLQLFSEFGRLIKQQSGKPFQALTFLVRDWEYDWQYNYGFDGGHQLLEFLGLGAQTNRTGELEKPRVHIRKCFEKVSCYLMPDPGKPVRRPSFKGNIGKVTSEFKTHLVQLVTAILGPGQLQPKLINGERAKARDLFVVFKNYMDMFNSGSLPNPSSIAEVNATAGFLAAVREGLAQYAADMEAVCGENQLCVPAEDLKTHHDQCKKAALNAFKAKKKMGTTKEAEDYLKTLSNDIDTRLKQYMSDNLVKHKNAVDAAKKAYENFKKTVSNGQLLCVHFLDVQIIHDEGIKNALTVFDGARKRLTNKPDAERNEFIKRMGRELEQLVVDNDRNNKQVISDLRMEYWDVMEAKTAVEPTLSRAAFQLEHELALQNILDELKNRRNHPDSHPTDDYKDDLIKTIKKRYEYLLNINESNNKKAIKEGFAEYNEHMRSVWNQHSETMHPVYLKQEHEAAVTKAFNVFRPNRTEAHGNAADIDERTLKDMLQLRYTELVETNDAVNMSAIKSALNVFKDTLEERRKPTWWWLLVVPMVVSELKSIFMVYHEESKQDAMVKFYKSRRRNGPPDTDTYLQKLIKEIDEFNAWKKFYEIIREAAKQKFNINLPDIF